jgi:hypothetical protein
VLGSSELVVSPPPSGPSLEEEKRPTDQQRRRKYAIEHLGSASRLQRLEVASDWWWMRPGT